MSYSIYGSEFNKGIGVIFAHGFFSNSKVFAPLIPEIEPICTVIVPDMIGRKPSDYADSKKYYTFERHLMDYITIINNSGLKKIIWVGTSLGALIGIKIASMHNSPIKALVVDNCGFCISEEESIGLRYQKTNYNFPNVSSIVDNLRILTENRFSEMEYFEFIINNFNLYNDKVIPNYDKELLGLADSINLEVDLRQDWSSIACPTLLLRALGSNNFSESIFNKMKNKEKVDSYEYIGDDNLLQFTSEVAKVVSKWINRIIINI